MHINSNHDEGSIVLDDLTDLVSDLDYQSVADSKCSVRIVESIPEGLTYNGSEPNHLSTYDVKFLILKTAFPLTRPSDHPYRAILFSQTNFLILF